MSKLSDPPEFLGTLMEVNEELCARVEKIAKETGIRPAILGNACLEAFVTYFETNKELNFPLHVVSKSDFEALQCYKQNGV